MTRGHRLSVAVFPRDPNPYQRLLYAEMEELDVEVRYLGDITPSRTLNLLLLPFELTVRRCRGLDIVHLHWVFGFELPFRARSRVMGALSEAWFRLFLRSVPALGLRLVWTAHNLLPHSPVFWDDLRARRRLVAAADLVLAHSESTLTGLAELGARPRRSAVVEHGPFPSGVRPASAVNEGNPLTIAFIGSVADYKGVEDLLSAFGSLPPSDARLVVAGRCSDPALAKRLRAMAEPLDRVELRLAWLSDDELDGVPLVVPDLTGFAQLPDAAVLRYEEPTGLADALARATSLTRSELRTMGEAGRTSIAGVTWADVADKTTRLFRSLVQGSGAPA